MYDWNEIADYDRRSGPDGDERIYFAFVESPARELPEGGEPAEGRPAFAMDCPDGSGKQPAEFLARLPSVIRMSGIRVSDFMAVEQRFDMLDPDEATDEQRLLRKQILGETFARIPIPVIDFYCEFSPDYFPDGGGEINPMAEGQWIVLRLRRLAPAEQEFEYFVWLADPDPGIDEPLSEWTALALLPPDDWAERRLRDIFSLVHVPDAIFEPGGEGGAAGGRGGGRGGGPGQGQQVVEIGMLRLTGKLRETESSYDDRAVWMEAVEDRTDGVSVWEEGA